MGLGLEENAAEQPKVLQGQIAYATILKTHKWVMLRIDADKARPDGKISRSQPMAVANSDGPISKIDYLDI